MRRLSAASVARTTEMYRLMVACLCVMVGNAETERCFSCQNHRDVPVDGRLPVRDGWERRDRALHQLLEPHQEYSEMIHRYKAHGTSMAECLHMMDICNESTDALFKVGWSEEYSLHETCNHITGLFFRMEYAVRAGMTSSTSSLCAWNVPSANSKLTHGQPIRLADFTFRKDHYFHQGNYIVNNTGPLHVFLV